MINEYPRYSKIRPELQQAIKNITNAYPPYSDFSFANLVSWNSSGGGRVSLLNNNLVLNYPDYTTGDHFVTFLGDYAAEATAGTLLDEAEQTTPERKLYLVPQIGASALAASREFAVCEDINSHDYVISLPKIAAMEGSEFRHFRRAVGVFLRENTSAQAKELDLTDWQVKADILRVFENCEAAKPYNDSSFELAALQKLFTSSSLYSLRTFGVEIGKELQAFIICEVVDQDWSIGHFWKADIQYRGIYSYLMHYASGRLLRNGITKMNIQQDLGQEGMRRFKNYMRPIANLKKYTVTDAPQQPLAKEL